VKLSLILNKKGFTLIEVIVGIALFGIITISFLPMFTFGIVNMHRSGNRTETVYKIQSSIEKNEPATPKKEQININFSGKEINININVYELEGVYDSSGSKTSIFYFEQDLSDS